MENTLWLGVETNENISHTCLGRNSENIRINGQEEEKEKVCRSAPEPSQGGPGPCPQLRAHQSGNWRTYSHRHHRVQGLEWF